jgi:hypothetical protein
MTVQVNGTTGVSLVQDGTVTSAKIVNGTIVASNLDPQASSPYRTSFVTPLPLAGVTPSIPHTLGRLPLATLELQCLVAEGGYTVGQILQVKELRYGTNVTPIIYTATSTSVGFVGIPNYTIGVLTTGGTGLQLTAANWQYRFILQ